MGIAIPLGHTSRAPVQERIPPPPPSKSTRIPDLVVASTSRTSIIIEHMTTRSASQNPSFSDSTPTSGESSAADSFYFSSTASRQRGPSSVSDNDATGHPRTRSWRAFMKAPAIRMARSDATTSDARLTPLPTRGLSWLKLSIMRNKRSRDRSTSSESSNGSSEHLGTKSYESQQLNPKAAHASGVKGVRWPRWPKFSTPARPVPKDDASISSIRTLASSVDNLVDSFRLRAPNVQELIRYTEGLDALSAAAEELQLHAAGAAIQEQLAVVLKKIEDARRICQARRAEACRVESSLAEIRKELDLITLTLIEDEAKFDARVMEGNTCPFDQEELDDPDLLDVNLNSWFKQRAGYLDALARFIILLSRLDLSSNPELAPKCAELHAKLRDCVLRRFQLETGALQEFIEVVSESGSRVAANCLENLQEWFDKFLGLCRDLALHQLNADSSNEDDVDCYEHLLEKVADLASSVDITGDPALPAGKAHIKPQHAQDDDDDASADEDEDEDDEEDEVDSIPTDELARMQAALLDSVTAAQGGATADDDRVSSGLN